MWPCFGHPAAVSRGQVSRLAAGGRDASACAAAAALIVPSGQPHSRVARVGVKGSGRLRSWKMSPSRLEADAPDMNRAGADLMAYYLSPDRPRSARQWSGKEGQRRSRR